MTERAADQGRGRSKPAASPDGGTANGTPIGEPAPGDEVAGLPNLFAAILTKRALLLIRYPVNTLSTLVTVYLFFAVIFFGGRAVAAGIGGGTDAFGSTLDGLIVGWFLWTMAIAAYFSLGMSVTRESQWGTLEQLYMSPYGFGMVMAGQVVAFVLESLLWGAIILPLMLFTTGREITVDLVTVAPVVVLTLLPVVGIGFVYAGGALLYKRLENVSQLMQFVLLGLIVAPASGVDVLRYLPMVQGAWMLQIAMQDGVRLWAFDPTDLGLLAVTAVGYLLAGYLVFRRASVRARRRGVMGHY